MNMQEPAEKLSTVTYWDEVLKSAKLPRINSRKAYLYSVTMKFIDKTINNPEYKTFFEVGCGSSGWLPYFSDQYKLKVSGLDYSDIGCQLARKNLELLNIEYGEILCRDFFSPDPVDGRKYDIVFSYGVIEHFSDPEKIIEIFKSFLTDKGLMITLVPNFSGLIGKLTKYFIPEVYSIHNTINKEQLKAYHEHNSLKILKNGYAGIFSLNVMPWTKSNHWLLKNGTARRKIFLFLLNAIDRIMGKLFILLPFDLPSRYLSPYVICIARRN